MHHELNSRLRDEAKKRGYSGPELAKILDIASESARLFLGGHRILSQDRLDKLMAHMDLRAELKIVEK